MKHLFFSLISLSLVAACGGPPRTGNPMPLPAPLTSTPPRTFPDSPVTALADEMCTLALDMVHERPTHFHRMAMGDVERHISHKMGMPEPPCLAVTFDVQVELQSSPNDVRGMDTDFVLTRRHLTAATYSRPPNPAMRSNVDVFPEIDRLYSMFADAVATNHAKIFQTSAVECRDLGISEGGKCERDMSKPVLTPEIAAAIAASSPKNRAIRLTSSYVFARAPDTLVRMQIDFDENGVVFDAEPRGP